MLSWKKEAGRQTHVTHQMMAWTLRLRPLFIFYSKHFLYLRVYIALLMKKRVINGVIFLPKNRTYRNPGRRSPFEKREICHNRRNPLPRCTPGVLPKLLLVEEQESQLHPWQRELLLSGGSTSEEITLWRLLLWSLCELLHDQGTGKKGGTRKCLRMMTVWTDWRSWWRPRRRSTGTGARRSVRSACIISRSSVSGSAFMPAAHMERKAVSSAGFLWDLRNLYGGRRWVCVFDYFYGVQADQFSFYRIPKVLFTDPYYKDLSTEAKVLYLWINHFSFRRQTITWIYICRSRL